MPPNPNPAERHHKPGMILRQIVPMAVIAVLLTGCTFLPTNNLQKQGADITWHEGLLRIIDPADASNPGTDIIAIFSSQLQDSLYFRIDFLDNPDPSLILHVNLYETPDQDADAGLDDVSLSFQPGKDIGVLAQELSGEVEVSLLEKGDDWLSFRIKGDGLLTKHYAKVITVRDGGILDETDQFDLQKTARPAYLFLSFYHTLNTDTPAQTLRSWDGAHTGPSGSRFGLRYLLEAASEYQVPITLLDIKQPSSLVALDQLAGLPLIRELASQNLLFLPESVYGDPSAHEQLLWQSQQSGLQYGFPVVNAAFGPITRSFSGYQVYFYASKTVPAPVYSSTSYRLVPLPVSPQVDMIEKTGFSVPALQILVKAGADQEPTWIASFGGDFQDTLWGDPIAAANTMEYISTHPWIHPLTSIDLFSIPAKSTSDFNQFCTDLICTSENSQEIPGDEYTTWRTSILPQLVQLQPSPLTDTAWQLYGRITNPESNTVFSLLKWKYRSTLEKLVLAAGWANQPYELQACYESSPQDYCILANYRFLAVISPETAGLIMLFARQNNQVTQVVAPYSQHMAGLSDPSAWKMDTANPDPALIESGFSLEEVDMVTASPNTITFWGSTSRKEIAYTLDEDSLQVNITSLDPAVYSLPLLGTLAGSGNEYSFYSHQSNDRISQSPLEVEISGASGVDYSSVYDNPELLTLPEDPNLAYPKGYYLPYPFSVLQIHAEKDVVIKFLGDADP